ncbi:hypothetical protein [Streptomyces sp. NPDC056600]|uniref:hypothetical protein n=1 Tax=Streptomyces sp. NPDC056600 TaxID=3345874 RepID=UPI003673D095
MRRKTLATVATVLIACTAGGCGTAGENEPAKFSAAHREALSVVSHEKLRDLTVAEEIEIEYAEHTLVKECMEQKGFSYWLGPFIPAEARKAGGYVIDDVEWAKKYGYGRPFDEEGERNRREHPNVRYPNGLSEEERIRYNIALDGQYDDVMKIPLPTGGAVETPREGCWVDARTALYGDLKTWLTARKTVTGLTPLYVPRIHKDSRLLKKVDAWARCMKKAGHPYSSPDEIRDKRVMLVKGMSARKAQETEVALAVTEAECARATSLGETARTLEKEYRGTLLKKYAKKYTTYRQMRLNALARARGLDG